jgi:dipeptidyl aminopeptidase/acylaminoacyl peptidase
MKKGNNWVLMLGLMLLSLAGFSQEKRALTPSDMPDWHHMRGTRISNNGQWITYEVNPNVGDGVLHVKNPDTGVEKTFERGSKAQFSPQNNYVVFMIKPQLDSLRKMKLDEVPRSKMPSDTFAIYVFDQDTLMKFDGIKSYKLAAEGSDWLTFQYKKPQKDKKPLNTGKKKKKKKKKSKKIDKPKSTKKPIKRKTSDLVMMNPVTGEKKQIKNVMDYAISEYGNSIGYICSFGDTIDSTGVYWFNNKSMIIDTSFVGLGNAKKPTFSEDGEEYIWILSADTGKAKAYSLYSTRGNNGTRIIVDTNDRLLPEGHTVSENGRVYFSRDGQKIFFGTAERPVEEPKDSIPTDEKATLDVWNWKDLRIQPMQLLRKSRDEKKTYLAVFHLASQKVVSLENDSTSRISLLSQGDSDYALLRESKKYDLSTSWRVPFPNDYYRLNLITGEKELIKAGLDYGVSISPSGKYFAYFNVDERAWYSINLETKAEVNMTQKLTDAGVILVNLHQEMPMKASSYRTSGWTIGEESILINTEYDIYSVDVKGEKAPKSLTNGKAEKEHLRVWFSNFDRDLDYVNLDSNMMLEVLNFDNNQTGILLRNGSDEKVSTLTMGEYSLSFLNRSKHVNRFIYRAGNFEVYPDLQYTGASDGGITMKQFEDVKKVSNALPEQADFLWGSVEKYYWKDENGIAQKGLLYYPENFDSTKKHPVMIYFYEKNFTTEYSRKSFRPSHSTIAIPLYTSNGYLVLVPDIHYGTGHPGKDGLNAVVSGAKSLTAKPFVDESKMAIQGQSWGGYQVAYIVTQTKMFAAAMAGAPVSNMTSAYGGIRWGSGMSREFQYEKTQSRIGKNLWDGLDLYIENSPIFHIPNVATPLLIMHNDNDGAVPYYQGIEMFMGMRRLQKPSWLLIYNKEQHNLRKMPNRLDLSLRMFQFFNHYLKGEPMPKWMNDGVPAVDKGKDYGFDLD